MWESNWSTNLRNVLVLYFNFEQTEHPDRGIQIGFLLNQKKQEQLQQENSKKFKWKFNLIPPFCRFYFFNFDRDLAINYVIFWFTASTFIWFFFSFSLKIAHWPLNTWSQQNVHRKERWKRRRRKRGKMHLYIVRII